MIKVIVGVVIGVGLVYTMPEWMPYADQVYDKFCGVKNTEWSIVK